MEHEQKTTLLFVSTHWATSPKNKSNGTEHRRDPKQRSHHRRIRRGPHLGPWPAARHVAPPGAAKDTSGARLP